MRPSSSPLALYLAVAYAALTAYASLHPLSGWRDTGAPALDFLAAAWPRYYTGFDLAANILAYVPLGFLLVPALQARLGIAAAALLAALAGAGTQPRRWRRCRTSCPAACPPTSTSPATASAP
jgi:VanZ family protein